MNAIERLESLTVGDVMTEMVVQVGAHQTMGEVARTMRKHHVSLVPVVDEQGRAVGVISAYDFVLREAEPAEDSPDLAADRMTPSIRAVAPHDTLLEAARILFSEHLHRLPVLDGRGRPRGVVSTMDVISALVKSVEEMQAAEAVRAR